MSVFKALFIKSSVTKKGRVFLCLAVLLMLPCLAYGQDGKPVEGEPLYIPLQPAFVVNYGGVGRLRYLKAELTVRVQDTSAADAVRHHMPYIRNNLVLLFSKQTEEALETQVGREALRQAALEEIRSILATESGEDGVVDLFFENFILQK